MIIFKKSTVWWVLNRYNVTKTSDDLSRLVKKTLSCSLCLSISVFQFVSFFNLFVHRKNSNTSCDNLFSIFPFDVSIVCHICLTVSHCHIIFFLRSSRPDPILYITMVLTFVIDWVERVMFKYLVLKRNVVCVRRIIRIVIHICRKA